MARRRRSGDSDHKTKGGMAITKIQQLPFTRNLPLSREMAINLQSFGGDEVQ
jgi:hypothetical protein